MTDLTVQEFFTSPGIDHMAYLTLLRAMEPKNEFMGHESTAIGEKTYAEVVNLEAALMRWNKGDVTQLYEIVNICYAKAGSIAEGGYRIPEREFYLTSIFDVFRAFNWILEQFTVLKENEEKKLSYEPTAEEMEAGIDSLGKYGRIVSIDTLAKGDILKWREIEQLSYNEVFFKLCMDKDRTDIERNLMKIKHRV